MTVREQIRAAYLASGMTITQIAVEAGVSEGTVVNVMRGRNVTVGNLFAVAAVLRVGSIDVEARCEPRLDTDPA